MSKMKSQQGTFGTYLELLQNKKEARRPDDNLRRLLKSLSEDNPKPISDALCDSGMAVDEFAGSLDTLEKLDLIKIDEQAGKKMVKLTGGGASYIRNFD